MNNVTRKTTNLLLELMEEGVIDPKDLVRSCLAYMSEADVTDMALCEEYLDEDEDEDEEGEEDEEDDEEDWDEDEEEQE